jgi:hypothetical protein
MMRALGLLLICVAVASADPVDMTLTDTQQTDAPASAVDTTLSFIGLPTALTDGTLTISVFGDFDHVVEYIDVSADSGAFNFGRFLNDAPADDLFNHPTDVGIDGSTGVTASANIPQTTLNSLLADGRIDVLLDYSTSVNLSYADDPDLVVSLRLQYRGADPTPEPSTLALVGLGAGFLAWRMRRRKRAA